MTPQEIRQTVRTLMRLDRLHHSVIDKQVGGLGIHRSQHMLLMHLAQTESKPSQKELCRRFDISAPAVTALLQKLEKEGFIKRSTDPSDSRQNEIHITPKGRDIVESSRHLFDRTDRAMLEGIHDKELSALSATLEKMMQNLKTYETTLERKEEK